MTPSSTAWPPTSVVSSPLSSTGINCVCAKRRKNRENCTRNSTFIIALAAEHEAGTAWIGAAVEHSPNRLDDGGRRGVAPIRRGLDQMTELDELLHGGARDAAFEAHLAGRELVKAERVIEVR